MIILRNFSKLFNVLGQIGAFLTVGLIGFIYINQGVWKFVSDGTLTTLNTIKEYAVLFTLVTVGLSFACKRNIFLFVIWAVLAAVALGFSFPALFA